jgi:FkbM family methyltransferase
MSRQDFTFTLTGPNGPRQLTYLLDPNHMSQRLILQELANGRLYESETANLIGSILQPGDAFIDIGAHVGYFTMLASALVGPQGAVYAFEPDNTNYAHLLDHIDVNQAENVRPLHMAVGARAGVTEFFVNADNDGGHALWEVGRHPFNEKSREHVVSRKVFLTTLDELFGDGLPNLKAIKIDAEGAEFAIMIGARALISGQHVPFIIMEINRFGLESMGSSEQQLRSAMAALGYETWLLQPGQTQAQRLLEGQEVHTDHVFNVLFRHAEAPAVAA